MMSVKLMITASRILAAPAVVFPSVASLRMSIASDQPGHTSVLGE